jgi:mRNA interferase MazF
MVEVVRRGEVWVANLNPRRGTETGKIRPVVIMQADELLEAGTPLVIVLPLTSRIAREVSRFRVLLPARDRLLRDSQVMVDQPRTLDRARLGDGPLTRLSDAELTTVEESLLAVLGMLR